MDKASEASNPFYIAKLNDYGVIPPFSKKEAEILAERLNNEESHREAQQVLIAWMEQGECNENNVTLFFSLIKLCHDYVKKLKEEQKECLEEVQKAEKNLGYEKIQYDLNKIKNAFKAIEKQDIWESFTPIQRKNIQIMKKDLFDLGQSTSNAVEEESTDIKNDAYKLKLILNRMINSLTSKTNEIREAKKVIEAKCKEYENEISDLKLQLEEPRKKDQMSQTQENPVEAAFGYNPDYDRRNEDRIMCSISFLLYEHQSGLNLDSIYSYLKINTPTANRKEIEFVLRRFPQLFKEIGLGQESKWIYIGFGIGKWVTIV
ncbi:hypothetical protein AVEN_146312-1 [Araneus ventricosus]|uniref:Uncharacterized protein n=1 Tax=Araneus ventricosus TaxID=182803 RepID=A0A4Y2I0L7_ARAVE|nr:hypothetical protein AVEN_146312-1 [Araneus ventricosus]